jgi:hypothetical protein
VIDTLIAAASYSKVGDDNDAAAAQKIMSTLAGLSQYSGGLALGVDHFGKVMETGTRGSSAKEGAADVVLALLADRELSGAVKNTRLAIRKQRDGASGLEIPFTTRLVEFGTDHDGDREMRLVIDWSPPDRSAPDDEKSWAPSLRLLRRILMATLADQGREIRPFSDAPMVRACALESVRAEFLKQYAADGDERQKTETRRKAFHRAVIKAQEKGMVAVRQLDTDQMIWLATKPDRPSS